jgi:AcrR family transcriptional regulator
LRTKMQAPGMLSLSGSRVERRRERREAEILEIAAHRFAAQGPDAVRLDEIAAEADIARGTLYSHFPSKEALVAAIVRPALGRAVAAFERVSHEPPRQAIAGLLGAYVTLWAEHRDALRVSNCCMQGSLPADLASLHEQLMVVVLRVFERAARSKLLRCGDAALASLTLARFAVPLLEQFEKASPDGKLFVSSMAGLLLKPVRTPRRKGVPGADPPQGARAASAELSVAKR